MEIFLLVIVIVLSSTSKLASANDECKCAFEIMMYSFTG